MMLQMNSCSGCFLKYHPLQHTGSVKPTRLPSTQINGLVNRSQRKNYSMECSFQSSFDLTNKIGKNEDIINRNHKPLNISTVALASQDDYASKSLDEKIVSTSFVDILKKKLYTFYHFSRPYAWTSIIVGILSSSLLPLQSLADLTPTLFVEILKCMVPTLIMNIFVSAINQLSDIEIDKVNKPHLPLASGDISKGEGIAIAVVSTLTSMAMGFMLRSPPIIIGLILRWIVGAAYSINLPLLRWKASPLMAAVTIIILHGLLQFPFFIHVQKYVLGRPFVFTKPLLFAAALMGIFSVALTFLKDIPDVEGDKKFGVQTLAVILGKEKVFSISVNMLLMAYGAAILAGASSPFLPCKLVTMISHSALGIILWQKARTIDLSDTKSTYAFFIFVFQLFYLEFFLIHFLR